MYTKKCTLILRCFIGSFRITKPRYPKCFSNVTISVHYIGPLVTEPSKAMLLVLFASQNPGIPTVFPTSQYPCIFIGRLVTEHSRDCPPISIKHRAFCIILIFRNCRTVKKTCYLLYTSQHFITNI